MKGRIFHFLTHPSEMVRKLGFTGGLAISFVYEGQSEPVRSEDIHVFVMSTEQAESLVASLRQRLSESPNPEPKEAA